MNVEDLKTVRFMTVPEVATFLRVSKMTVYRLCNKKILPSIRAGRSFRIAETDVVDYLNKGGGEQQ